MSWQPVPLGELAEVDTTSVKAEEIPSDIPFVGLEHIRPDGTIDFLEPAGKPVIKSNKYRFDDRHLLFGKLRPYLRKIAAPDFSGVCSTDIVPLLPIAVSKRYLFHFLRQQHVVDWITQRAVGANLPRVKPSTLLEVPVPAPPIEEQHRIAAILDKADHLRSLREQAIAKLDQLARSIFLDMFGGAVQHAGGWEVTAIEGLAADVPRSMRTGPFGSDLRHGEFVNEGIPVLGIDNVVDNVFKWKKRRFITPSKFERLKRYQVRPGDVLISIMATNGRSAVVPHDIGVAINTKHLAAITLDRHKCEPEYLSFCIHSDPFVLRQITDQSRGAIMDGLNLSIIKETKVRVPPRYLQERFVRRLSEIRSLRSSMEYHDRKLESLQETLSHKAFAGEAQW